MAAPITPAPIRNNMLDIQGNLTVVWVQYFQALTQYINSLEKRLEALDGK